MHSYVVKAQRLAGSSDKEVIKKAQDYFKAIVRKTKRQPYIRSAYFGKQKIFFTFFWKHTFQKPLKIRAQRLAYLPCAIELIQRSRNAPTTKPNPNKKSELLHRFYGATKNKANFYVQIKENKNTKRKELMSIVVP